MKLLRVVALTGLVVVVTACGGKSSSSEAGSSSVTPLQTSTTTTSTVVEQPLPSTCASIAFTPNSEDTAAEIQVKGVTCETADPVIRAVKSQVGKNYDLNGFTCTTTGLAESETLPYYTYTCTGIAGFDNQHILFRKY
jgi:hypothetical protein